MPEQPIHRQLSRAETGWLPKEKASSDALLVE
jgi:hypothetical protein